MATDVSTSALPQDFDATLRALTGDGLLEQDPLTVRQGLASQVHVIGSALPGAVLDDNRVQRLLRNWEVAIHQELCDPDKGKLKERYDGAISGGMTPQGVAAVSAVILPVVQAINPAFAVSSVVIYISVWLLKAGLNHWCATKPTS